MRCNARGKGEAVLFIHGMPTNARLWDGVLHTLSPHFRCFAIDLPGMGGTPFLPYSPAYFEQVAAQIERVRVRHGVQRWHIVAHDGGCAIALQYAHLFPKRVNRMALLSPAIFADLRPFFLLNLLRKRFIGEITAPLIHAIFWQIAMKRAIPNRRNAAQRISFEENFSGFTGPWRMMRLVRWGKPEIRFGDFPSILRTLDCSTLVIHGSRDILPDSFARRAAELIPTSQLIELDSGHFIPIEQAEEVGRNLLAHFKSIRVEVSPPHTSGGPNHSQQQAADGGLLRVV